MPHHSTNAPQVYGKQNKLFLKLFLCTLVGETGYFIYKLYAFTAEKCEFCHGGGLWTFLTFYSAVNLLLDIGTIMMTVNCLRRFGDGMKEAVQRGRIMNTSEGKYYMKGPTLRPGRKRSELEIEEDGASSITWACIIRLCSSSLSISHDLSHSSCAGVVRRRSSGRTKSQKSFENKLNRFSFLKKDYT
jgi:hypothetical protein